MRSIVADDVLVIRKLLHRALSKHGSCDEAVSGKEAVAMFIDAYKKGKPYDLICLDILMPNKDGLQVIKDIRQFESQNNIAETKRVKIIMTTSLKETSVVSQAIESGCDGYMAKPILLDKLYEQIRKFGLID